MSKALKRSIKTAQIALRELNLKIKDSGTTPAADGPDEFEISSIVDLGGLGNYTIILKNPASEALDLFVAGWSGPADTAVAVTAVAYDRVTIQVTDLANVAKDADVSLCVKAHDARYRI